VTENDVVSRGSSPDDEGMYNAKVASCRQRHSLVLAQGRIIKRGPKRTDGFTVTENSLLSVRAKCHDREMVRIT